MVLLISNIIAWFVDKLLVGPVWWIASYLAAYVYPFEDSNEHWLLSLGICIVIFAIIILLFVFL